MAYRVDIDPAAVRDLSRLPRDVLPRIDRAIMRLAENPRPRGALKLRGSSLEWRIRVGNYRVIYEIHDDRLVVRVVRAAHRREAYGPSRICAHHERAPSPIADTPYRRRGVDCPPVHRRRRAA